MFSQQKGVRFLVVEDDDDHAELITFALESIASIAGIDRARDGEEALNYLQQQSSEAASMPPRVVLLDLKLPKVDGIEVLSRIKKDRNLQSTPVIILTTSRAEMDKIRAYENNANSYLVKPMDFAVFETVLKQIGHYWSACNQPAPAVAAKGAGNRHADGEGCMPGIPAYRCHDCRPGEQAGHNAASPSRKSTV